MLDAHCTSGELASAKPEIAVLGVGAVEQHSHHLPVGTDWIGVAELTRRVSEELGAYCVPALPFSMSQCHGPMAGTVFLRPETLAEVVRDAVRSLAQSGIRKVVLINGHGGNFVLETTIQELNLADPSLSVIMPASFGWGPSETPIFESAGLEVHAGESETSNEMYVNGEHVGKEWFDYVPPFGREFLDYAYMLNINPHGTWGKPSLASVEKGELDMSRRVASIVRQVRDAFATLDALRTSSTLGDR